MANKVSQPRVLTLQRELAPLVLVLFSALAAALAYLQALDYPMILDDGGYIIDNTKLQALPLIELWRLFIEPYNNMTEFLPLRDFSYWLDMTLFGLYPPAFRWHNLALYLLCLPLVYVITLKLWGLFHYSAVQENSASAVWAAATVTALFALHPSHVEAVIWISGRKDVLSGLFSLLALWLALGVKKENGFSTRHATSALLMLLAAMLSKAAAVAIAPVIALFWLIFWRDIPLAGRRRVLLLYPLASLLLAVAIALIFAPKVITKIPFYFGVEAITRSVAVLGWLARLAFSAESRHFIYPVFEDSYLGVMVVLGLGVLVAAVGGGVMLLRRHTGHSCYLLEGLSLVIFLLLCLINIQLIPYALPSLVSDRFLFLAVWPAMLLLVSLAWRLRPMLRAALLLSIMLAFTYQTVQRPQDWRSHDALFEADWVAYPGHYMTGIYKIFGVQLQHYLYADAENTANRITDPIFRQAMVKLVETDYAVRVAAQRIGHPHDAMALLWQTGLELRQRPTEAQWNAPISNFWNLRIAILKLQWEWLAKTFPTHSSVSYNAGQWMLEAGKYQGAVAQLRVTVESQRLQESERGAAFYSLGLALIGSGQMAEAEVPLRMALKQSPPDLRAHCLLSAVYKQSSRPEEAARAKANCPNRAP